jgi:hypothetical protein
VLESDPSLGNVTTNYTYNILNHLTLVSMPRGANTQNRTFNYNTGTTVTGFLQTATNPRWNGSIPVVVGFLARSVQVQSLANARLRPFRLTTLTTLSPSGSFLPGYPSSSMSPHVYPPPTTARHSTFPTPNRKNAPANTKIPLMRRKPR